MMHTKNGITVILVAGTIGVISALLGYMTDVPRELHLYCLALAFLGMLQNCFGFFFSLVNVLESGQLRFVASLLLVSIQQGTYWSRGFKQLRFA